MGVDKIKINKLILSTNYYLYQRRFPFSNKLYRMTYHENNKVKVTSEESTLAVERSMEKASTNRIAACTKPSPD